MTLTTPAYGWPYPQPADARGAGANTARDGLLAVEATVKRMESAATVATIQAADSPSAAGGGVVDFPGAQVLAGFTYAAGTLTYTGTKPRMFVLWASVEIQHGSGGALVASQESTVYVNVGGTAVASSYDLISSSSTDLGVRRHVHNVTAPLILAPGQAITVTASSTPAGTVGQCALRVYPIGPLDA